MTSLARSSDRTWLDKCLLLQRNMFLASIWETALLWMFSACLKNMRLDSCMSDSLSFVNKSNLCLILSSSFFQDLRQSFWPPLGLEDSSCWHPYLHHLWRRELCGYGSVIPTQTCTHTYTNRSYTYAKHRQMSLVFLLLSDQLINKKHIINLPSHDKIYPYTHFCIPAL